MRAAADLEDNSAKHIAMENRLYPMRELLGDLLLANSNSRDQRSRNTGSLETYRPLPTGCAACMALPRPEPQISPKARPISESLLR
jgi:hypothetical protein